MYMKRCCRGGKFEMDVSLSNADDACGICAILPISRQGNVEEYLLNPPLRRPRDTHYRVRATAILACNTKANRRITESIRTKWQTFPALRNWTNRQPKAGYLDATNEFTGQPEVATSVLRVCRLLPRAKACFSSMSRSNTRPTARGVFERLRNHPRCSSRNAIEIDDLIVQGLFEQKAQKPPSRTHLVQSIGLSRKHEVGSPYLDSIYRAFEAKKSSLMVGNAPVYLRAAGAVRPAVTRSTSEGKALIGERAILFDWLISAYSMIIAADASVHLWCIRMLPGQDNSKGFAVYAAVNISKDQDILELIGIMPTDNDTPHSYLSSITPAPDQDQEEGEERVLVGPCLKFNGVRGTSAFVVKAIRDIKAGEEITIDYGPSWFQASTGSACPCKTCAPQPHLGDPAFWRSAGNEEDRRNKHKARKERAKEQRLLLKEGMLKGVEKERAESMEARWKKKRALQKSVRRGRCRQIGGPGTATV
ncbi:hypothetical protein FA13DRAFT_1796957 [Coprinellus micaceus]|uniref:SET domain-containing protein n=1 Tax=Coprinellus micaceus TaxID=71717 RepID=A0A4Y7SSC3_COPMI|nr:hypothetical protein FA13DRAFT_1796957 [Coprinellus micaceus]